MRHNAGHSNKHMDILMAIIYLKLQFCISFDTKQLIKTNLMKMFDRISRWPLY
jgi:hypothetical protein